MTAPRKRPLAIGDRVRVAPTSPSTTRDRTGTIVRVADGGPADLCIAVRLDEGPAGTYPIWIYRPCELMQEAP
jgi:hypothetical protein